MRVLRAEPGLTQAELARMATVSRQTINAIETDKSDPNLPVTFKLAEVFDLQSEDVLLPDERGAGEDE